MQRCLDFCVGRQVMTVKLDATDLGRPVYEKFGFVEEYVVERWKGTLAGGERREFEHNYELDRMAFGADRRALVERLAFSRAGRVASYAGPVVSRTAEEARERIVHGGAQGVTFWDIPMVNAAAVGLAEELGFASVRRLWRMSRGPAINESPDLVYALGGFEYG
jgi:hypothetical protein